MLSVLKLDMPRIHEIMFVVKNKWITEGLCKVTGPDKCGRRTVNRTGRRTGRVLWVLRGLSRWCP